MSEDPPAFNQRFLNGSSGSESRHVPKFSHPPGRGEHGHEGDHDGPFAPEGAVFGALLLGGLELERGEALVEGVEAFVKLAAADFRDGLEEFDVEPVVPIWGEKPWHGVQDSVMRFQSHILDILNGHAEPQPSGADNLKTLALALAAYDSAEKTCT